MGCANVAHTARYQIGSRSLHFRYRSHTGNCNVVSALRFETQIPNYCMSLLFCFIIFVVAAVRLVQHWDVLPVRCWRGRKFQKTGVRVGTVPNPALRLPKWSLLSMPTVLASLVFYCLGVGNWGGGWGGQNEFMRQRISSLLIVSFRGPLWWPSEMLLSASASQGHLITPLSRVLLLVVLQQYLFGAAQ